MKRQKEKIGRKILSFVLTVALIVSNMTGIVPGTSLKALAVDDITISSVEDWNSFAASVKGGETYSGKTVTLTADVGPVTTMADGSFSGTFDGGGHTLTVDISGGAVATFNAIKGGTIKNLNLAGSVTGSLYHSAALAVKVDGSCTIDKVNVATVVNSSTDYAGGFIGHGMTGNTITITNSEFSGSINSINATGSQALYFGGFLGWCGKSTATIENCAFAGTYSNVQSFNAVGFSCGAMQKVSVSGFYSNVADIYGYTKNSGTRMYNPTGGQQAVAARVDSGDTRTYYNTFSSALENWTDGSTLALLADATTSGGITLSESGASKTLDLNGQTLIPGGPVSVMAGSLTLLGTNGGELKRDVQVINVSEGATFNLEGGTVSGTLATKDQSAINGHGTFNLNGGTVQSAGSNALSLYGKATLNLNGSMVCATSDSTEMTTSSAILTNAESDITINVSGGTISTNTGCGIYTRGTGTTVNISGGVFTSTTGNYAVSGNNQKTINLSGNPKMEGKGIYLLSGKKITINGELTNTTPIGVTMQTVGVFTDSAEVAFNDAGKFTSDDAAYMVGKNADGQLYLDTAVTATFETEHGTAPASQTVVTGAKITLPDAPEVSDYTFGGWQNGSTTYEAGTEVTLDASKTFTAQWTQGANLVIKQGDYIRMGAYNGYDVDWFCAKVNATGVMMMSKYVITNSRFGANATYKTSDIHAWLDLDSGGWFATDLGLTKKELSLVRTVNLAGTNGDGTDSFIIPAYGNNEMNKGTGYTQAGYINNPSSIASVFWLRTPRDSSNARVVRSQDAKVVARYSGAVYGGRGVRPMFYLDTKAIKNMPYTGSGTADDPYSFVPQTGRGTQADPYVFYPRHYIYTDVSIGGSISASASRDDIVIYKAKYKGVQTNKLVEEAEVTLTVKPDTGYVFDDILIRLNSPTATNVNAKLTALSGTQGKNNENYEKLVDGVKSGENNKWCLDFNAANPPYIIVKADKLVAMTGYSLTTGNDTNNQSGRNWKDWTIYGANFASDSEATVDSDKWKVVTSVSNDNKLEAKNYTTYNYALESEAEPYQYYKIVITASKGQALIQMSEFTMTGNTYEKLDVTQDGDSYTFMMPKKYDVNDVKVKATFLGTVYFLKKDVNEQWTAVANAEKAWFAGSTYNVTDEIANKYSAEKYAFKGYSLNYSDSGEYTAASAGQAISLGTGQSPLYLYYELERNDLVIYQDAAGKAVYKTVNLPYGASLAGYANEVPEAQDYYTFAGWSTTKNLDSYDTTKLVDWPSLTMNEATIEVYPIWVHDRVEVKLSSGYDDSKNIEPFFVELDGSINTAGQNMTRDGYDLEGWYTQNGTKWNDAWKVTPEYCDVDAEGNSVVQTDNEKKYNYYILTLTAHWKSKTREVIYATGEHVKDGTTAPANGSVTMGNALTLASAPEAAEGWLFTGWKDANNNLYSAGGSFSFNDWSVVGTDDKITLTAQYVEKAKVKLFFETNGGTVIEPITEYAGTEISLANYITTRAGYTFTEWSDGINEYSSTGSFQVPDSGTEMVTLTAGWTVNQYTVSFDTLGGTGVGSITQDYGSTITTPENPTKDHYEFKGWYPEFPTTMPSENITLKAIWEPISYTVKFMNGDAEYDSISGIYGAEITAPVDPTKDDYVFDGWKDAENKKLTFPAYISGSETYTASWRKAVSYVVTFKVANGQWDNGDTEDLIVILNGYEGDALKLSAAQIPAVGTKPNDTFKAGSWNVTPDTATIISDSTAYTYTYAQKDVISREVTFKVVDGTWNDGTNDDKTVTLTCYEGEEATLKLSATKIPEVGIKPAEGYMEGDWDEIPDTENALTENVTYIYIYTAKEEASVTKEPAANNLTYNGGTQKLATAGEASGGTMEYAVGTDETAEPAENAYGESIPERTNAGTYYVWYRVSPDATHSGTAPACVKVEIAKKTITISGITADDKEFDNTKDVTLRFNEIDWLSCGMVEGDSLNITASGSFSDANIGTGKTVSITGLILGGSSVANYMLAETGQQAETTANISPKTLTGIAAANVEVTYDGAEHTITVTGVPEGATVSYGTNADSITLTQAPSYVNANETAYTIYYKVSCANSSDFTGSATVKINKKAATITANNTGKTYGSNDPKLTAIVSGVVGTEALNYTLSRKPGENVEDYEITVTLGENPNYEVTAKNGTFTIGKKAATVTAKAAGKVYGDTDPELTATVEGVVGTDALNYSLARADGEKADEYAITVTLGSNPNYEVTTVGNTFTISKKTATVTADAKNKIFGENDPKLTATVTGLVGEDTLNYSLSREEGENTNNYEITVTLGENPNYEVTATNGVFTIKKANLSTAGAENVNAVYDGEGHGITVIGIPEGATLTYGTSADDITLTQAPTFVDARDIAYTVYYKVISANYNDFVSAATVKIDKRDITITADDKSSKYGTDLQELTYQISNGSIVNGDDLGIGLTTAASKTAYVNTYAITVSWNGNTNYNATLENGIYTITRADLTVSASGYNGIYDGVAHGITVDVGTSGEIVYYAEDELTEANYNVAGSVVAPTYVNAGIYSVYYYVVPTNYDPQPVKGSQTVNIDKKALTITADSDSKVYDTTALTKNSFSNTAIVAGDAIESVTITGTQTSVGSSANVPSAAVIKKGDADVTANYDITYANGALTVTKALTNNVTVSITG